MEKTERKDSFIVYAEDIKEILDELTDEEVGRLFRGMITYQLTGEDPGFTGAMKFAFIPIRQTMTRNDERYAAKCERNRANANKRWGNDGMRSDAVGCDRMRSDAMDADNDNDNERERDRERDNDRDNDRESAGADVWSLSRSVLSFLNEAAGTSYRTDAAESVKLISALSHKGYTEDQMRAVVEKMTGQWLGDPKMEQYLRPSTLFKMSNFEKYLQAPDSARKKKRDEERKREQNKVRYREAMAAYKEQISAIDEKMEGAAIPEKVELRGQKAILEARLSDLEHKCGAS